MHIPIRVYNQYDSSYGTKLSVVVDHSKLRFSRINRACTSTTTDCDPNLRCQPSSSRTLCGVENPNLRCVPSDSGALCDVGNPLLRTESV